MKKKKYQKLNELPYGASQNEVLFESHTDLLEWSWALMEFHRTKNELYSQFPLHWQRTLEVIIPLNGCAEIWMKNKRFIVEPGMMMIIEPGTIHASRRSDFSMPYDGYALIVRNEFLCSRIPSFSMLRFPDEPVGISIDMIGKLNNICMLENSQETTCLLECDIKILEFILWIIKEYASESKEKSTVKQGRNKQELVSAVIHLLQDSVGTKEPITSIADKLHINYAYLSRIFKSAAGVTMSEVRDEICMDYARNYLIMTDSSLNEISQKLGFSSAAQFSRKFRSIVGCSPSEYRENKS